MIPSSAQSAWISVQDRLRRQVLKNRQDWIDQAKLLRVLSGSTLMIALPPRGKTIFAALQHKRQLQKECRQAGYGVVLTVYPDEWQRHQARERFGIEFEELESA